MNISIWVDDLKSIANFTVWGEDQIMLYRNVVAGKTYKKFNVDFSFTFMSKS